MVSKDIPYHSALKGTKLEQSVPVDRFTHKGSLAFVYDAFEPVPTDFDACDFFYMEPPYPAGAKVFDERVNISGRTYADLASRIADFISTTQKPVVIPMSKTVLRYYPTPTQTLEVDFVHSKGGQKTTLAVWNTYLGNPKTTEEALLSLLDTYECVGDMFCGYGHTALVALSQGKKFVVSDYNPLCIGYLAERLNQNDHS
jgi:16S rRNA G966 N2-methylase RsmD